MDATFIQARINFLKTAIVAYETAILALQTGGVQSYMIDTGQTSQRVTKADLSKLQGTYSEMLGTLDALYSRLNGATIYTSPAW